MHVHTSIRVSSPKILDEFRVNYTFFRYTLKAVNYSAQLSHLFPNLGELC